MVFEEHASECSLDVLLPPLLPTVDSRHHWLLGERPACSVCASGEGLLLGPELSSLIDPVYVCSVEHIVVFWSKVSLKMPPLTSVETLRLSPGSDYLSPPVSCLTWTRDMGSEEHKLRTSLVQREPGPRGFG